MTLKQTGFEGTTSGAAFTAASSGGTSGDALTLGTVTGTYSATYDDQAIFGARALRVTGTGQFRAYYADTAARSFSARFAYRPAQQPVGSDIDLFWLVEDSSFAQALTVRHMTTGAIRITNKAGSAATTSSYLLAADTDYQLQVYGVQNSSPTTTNGEVHVRLYVGENTTPVWSYDSTAFNLGVAAGFVRSQWGKITNGGTSFDATFDSLAANIGSSSPIALATDVTPNTGPVADAGADQTVEAGAAVTLAVGGTDADGTIASLVLVPTSGPDVVLTQSPDGRFWYFTAPVTLAGTSLTFTLTARDDDNATDTDTVTVTVEPAPIAYWNGVLPRSNVRPTVLTYHQMPPPQTQMTSAGQTTSPTLTTQE